MKGLKETYKLIKRNALSIMGYELLMKLISYAALFPALYALVNVAVKVSGVKYLYRANIGKFFRAPTTYLFFILIILIYAFMNLINISGVILAIDASKRKKRVSIPWLFSRSFGHAFRVLKFRNFPVLIVSVFLFPMSSLAFTSLSLLNIKIPGYIVTYIKKQKILTNSLMIGYAVLSIASFAFIYMLNFYVLKRYDFKKSAKESIRMLKKGGIRKVVGILLANAIVIFMIFGLSGFVSNMFLKVLKSLSKAKSLNYLLYMATSNVNSFFYLLLIFLIFPILFGYISVQYYNIIKKYRDSGEFSDVTEVKDEETSLRKKKKTNRPDEMGRFLLKKPDADEDPRRAKMYERAVAIMVLLIVLVVDAAYYVMVRVNIISLDAAHLNTAVVTAHRGDSKNAPENTLAAFDLAIENGADVVELDVRETKDGEIIVIHDKNLIRTTGVNANVEDLTFEEIRQIPASTKFKDTFPDEKIPTLREAIELVKGRADLNIELKPDPANKRLEEGVVELIEEYDLYDSCVVTSLSYKAIKKVKLLDKRIKTVYVMSVAGGNYYDLKYADAYSINYRFIDNMIVNNIHKRGKEIYVWTVNNKVTLENMMLLNVDNVITDNPGFVKDSMYETYRGGLFSYIVRRFAFK